MFVDVSGFTRLSERLARKGHEGAEQLADAINACFSALLADAYGLGGALLKFGGDALLLWFEGEEHAARGADAAVAMRSTLRRVGRIDGGPSRVVLRMSVGVHTGAFEMFLVGCSHREFIIAGPAAGTAVGIEALASAGQILVSSQTAERLPASCLGPAKGDAVVLARAPGRHAGLPTEAPARPADAQVAQCLSTAVRAQVTAGTPVPEHRTASVAFLQFGGVGRLLEVQGASAVAAALERVVCVVQEAADRYQVCVLGSDIADGGGKLILTAGAPRAVGEDEERMLLALRQVVDSRLPLPVRIGVNRGRLFAGEIGPWFRRTYTVMGDTVNLAARLMGQAPWGEIYATPGLLGRSRTPFETTAVPPFMVKGKSRPVTAVRLGRALKAGAPGAVRRRLPLVGRDAERAALEESIASARDGRGALIELVGETGSGKSRLLAEAREIAQEMHFVHATCEAYCRNVPYVAWRDPLRQLLGLGWDDDPESVLDHLRSQITAGQRDLLPWLPLLAIPLDAEAPLTREVEELAPGYRAVKLHEVVLRFLEPALQVPTLIQIEHAHVMDEASAALLEALAARLPSSAWVVIVTRRDLEEGFVAPDDLAKRFELAPLSAQEALALAEATPEAHALTPDVLELAVERAGGSPEFLLDLLAAAAGGAGELPDSVEAAASARIDALDPGDRALVRRAAVLGVSFHSGRLSDVLDAGSSEPDEEAWRRLSTVFARDPDGHIRFKRPALRDVAYHSLPFRLRRQLHAAVAESLEHDVGEDVDADPAVLSFHWLLAGNHEKAWRYARAGAERAVKRFAHADAARLYRRAIEAGRFDGASPAELAAVWEALGESLQRAGQLSAAADAVSAARRLVPEDSLAQTRLLYQQAVIARRSHSMSAAVRWAHRGLRSLESIEAPEAPAWRARLLGSLGFTRLCQGRPLDAERLCREAIASAEVTDDQRTLAYALYILDLALVESGRAEQAVHSPRALEIYSRLGDVEQQGNVLNNMAAFAYHRGAWDEALGLYSRAAECRERAGNPAEVAVTICNIGEILSDRGQHGPAQEHLTRALRVWTSTGDRDSAAFARALLGRLAMRAGRIEEALELLNESATALRAFGSHSDAELAEALIAEAEAFGGDPLRAMTICDRMLDKARREAPLLRRARGIALMRLGDESKAEHEFAVAIALAREHGVLFELAAAADALNLLGGDQRCARERDAILAQLGIEWLPRPLLQPVVSPAESGEALAVG